MSPSFSQPNDASTFAALGVSLCLIGLAIPVPSSMPLVALVAGALVAAWLGGPSDRRRGIPSPLMGSFAVFILACGLSIFFSEDRTRSLELSASWIPGVLLFVVVGERFKKPWDIRAFFGSYCLVALGLALVLLWGRWTHGPNAHDWLLGLQIPILVVPNDCHLLALTSPFGLALFRRNPRSPLGVVGILSLIFSALAIIALGSRGAVLTLITCLVIAGTLLRPRLGLMIGLSLLVLVVVFDAVLGFPLSSKFTHVIDTRLSLWLMAWEMFLDAPLLGHGPYTYKILYSQYLDSVAFPSWVRLDPWGGDVPWAHNLYLEILAERGAIGGLAFVGVVGTTLFYGYRNSRTLTGERAELAGAVLASLVGFLASGLFEASFLRVWAVVLIFCLMGAVGLMASWQKFEDEPDASGRSEKKKGTREKAHRKGSRSGKRAKRKKRQRSS